MLRKATIDDAGELGAVHVAAWRETYAGLLPDEMLANLSVEARTAMWTGMLGDPSTGTVAYVAEDQGSIIGFGACGSQRDTRLKELGFDAEVGAIYVLRAKQSRGIGRMLMREMATDLRAGGHKAIALWVLRENAPARAFYRHLGGEVVMEKEDRRGAVTLIEVAYGWREPWKNAASPHSPLGARACRG